MSKQLFRKEIYFKFQVTLVVNQIANIFIDALFPCLLVSELNATIKNALKLFMEHGILESYTHSSVTVLYLKDFCNHDNLLKLVYDFAQLC